MMSRKERKTKMFLEIHWSGLEGFILKKNRLNSLSCLTLFIDVDGLVNVGAPFP